MKESDAVFPGHELMLAQTVILIRAVIHRIKFR